MSSGSSSPALPDYFLEYGAVLKDTNVKWRNGRAPDYKRMHADYEAGKQVDHKPGTFAFLVNNLVKNWEIEASYKPIGSDWRTIDPTIYKFKSNDGPWLTADDMIRLGTYNAVIGESQYYSSDKSNFLDSHKTFKRAIRSFNWEVIEVYSELPVVAFKWRHFGLYHGKFTSYIQDGSKIESDPTQEMLNWTGMSIAHITPDFRIASIESYSDPAELFRQMTKNGIRTVVPSSTHVEDGGHGTTADAGARCPMGYSASA
jgi:hypothetical protein